MRDAFENKAKSPDRSDEKISDIRERAFAFAVRIVKLCQYPEKHSKVSKTLITQLLIRRELP